MRALWCLIGGVLVVLPVPAAAQVVASVSFLSDERFRGRSVSEEKPVATLNVSYDDASGAYVGGSATAVVGEEAETGLNGVGLMSHIAYVGYATRTAANTTLDVGLINYRYSRLYSGRREINYVEAFAGVTKGGVSAYLNFSPRYFDRPFSAVYLNVSASRQIAAGFNLTGHVGILAQTSGEASLGNRRSRYDTRLSLSRALGKFEVHGDWTFGGPSGASPGDRFGGRSAFVVGISRSF